ncbi:MAG: heme o synthase [Alphaproteobacteria bacterium]
MGATAKALYSVFKLRIGFAIALSAVAGLAVTPGPVPSPWKIAVLAVAVLLSAASAGAFNQYVERELDSRMVRTEKRPFVTGFFTPGPAWPIAIVLLLVFAVALAWVVLNPLSALHVFLGAFVYGVVYTVWLKRRSWLNIVIGGLSGSFAVLAGASAVDPHLSITSVVLALVLFLWTPPHFWSLAMALRDQYARAGVPMLPVVVGDAAAARAILWHTVALALLSLVPVAFGLGLVYAACAALGGALFVRRSVALVAQPGPKAAMANFHASLAQLSLLLVGAIVDQWLVG